MAQGLQCWDKDGKLIVDIGDYNLRFIKTLSFTYPANSASYKMNDSNIKENGFICLIRYSDERNNHFPEYYGIPLDGGVLITTENSNFNAQSLIMDVMAYL